MANRERSGRPQREEKDDLIKKLVEIRRVAKVVKGGRTMRFSALVVVGNGAGEVGIGISWRRRMGREEAQLRWLGVTG